MKGRHVIGLTIVVIIASISLRSSYATLLAMHNIVFCIDDHIICKEKHAIIDFIQELHTQNATYTSETILLIRQQFPFIESIHIALLANNMMQYTIHVAKPCCTINHELVFTENHTLLNKQIFTPASIQELPVIFVDEVAIQKEQGLHGLQQCIASLPLTLFSDYKVTWMNAMHVRLYDKNEPRFSIVFSADRLPDTRTLAACSSIKQDISSLKKNIDKKRGQLNTNHWAADIRFNNQIVLYAEKGDRGHG